MIQTERVVVDSKRQKGRTVSVLQFGLFQIDVTGRGVRVDMFLVLQFGSSMCDTWRKQFQRFR